MVNVNTTPKQKSICQIIGEILAMKVNIFMIENETYLSRKEITELSNESREPILLEYAALYWLLEKLKMKVEKKHAKSH